MSLKVFSFYHRETGELHSKTFKCSPYPGHEEDALRNAPDEHHHVIEGHFHPWKHRFDLATRIVVEDTSLSSRFSDRKDRGGA